MPYKDPEKRREAARKGARKWRAKNRELVNAMRREAYHRDPKAASARVRAWYHKNRERALRRAKEYQLRKRYGLTHEQFLALGNACAICGAEKDPRKGFRLAVDHDHATNKIRGVLCGNCNCGIGYFRHDEALMLRAIEYLRRTA